MLSVYVSCSWITISISKAKLVDPSAAIKPTVHFRMLFERNTIHFRLVVWEIGTRSIYAKMTQTANPIVDMTKTIGLLLMISTYCPISL